MSDKIFAEVKLMKEFSIIIRNAEDEERLREMLNAGWKILNRVALMQEGEPPRAEYHLYKEESPDK